MTALIVEDEAMARERLARNISDSFPDIEVVGMTDSVRSTVDWLGSHTAPDVIFMDVELADGECFEIFRLTRVSSQVIMTTAYDSYAIKAFETGSIDYLLKPYDMSALQRAVGRCRERLSLKQGTDIQKLLAALGSAVSSGTLGPAGASGLSSGASGPSGAALSPGPGPSPGPSPAPYPGPSGRKAYRERMVVRIGEQIIPLELSDVACFYSEGKSNYIMTFGGRKYVIDTTMDSLDEGLDPSRFFRVSRGCIVSRKAVRSVTRHLGSRLRLSLEPAPPVEMTVSRARVDDFLAWLE